MLLLLLLFKGLLWHGESTAAPQVLGSPHPSAEEPLSFHLIHIVSFANHSWAETEGSGWLGDLETQVWDSASATIHFLKPWSHGNFSKEELKRLQAIFELYLHGFPRAVQHFASQFEFEYPFVLQVSAGCTVHAGTASQSFLKGAYQGSDFLSFQGHSWEPSPGAGHQAQIVCSMLNLYRDIREIVQSLLFVCPRFLAGLLAAGKSEIERQVKPKAWLSSGPSPGPGRLQLVCHVSGFHPKPVWVMWMRGEQEQPGTRQDILPNADETWYLRATLDVAAGQAAGLSCRVKHSSLGGHDIVLHWGGHSFLLTLICLTAVLTLVTLLVLNSRCRKQSPQSIPAFPLEATTQDPRGPAHQLCLAQESWIKKGIVKLKISLNQLW